MIDVSCALITGHNGKILAAKRSALMRLPLKWEFPGGKVEQNETAEGCIIRELKEELGVEVEILKAMVPAVYDDGNQKIRLIPFICIITSGEIRLAEHEAYLWLSPADLNDLDWASADIPVVQQYLNSLSGTI